MAGRHGIIFLHERPIHFFPASRSVFTHGLTNSGSMSPRNSARSARITRSLSFRAWLRLAGSRKKPVSAASLRPAQSFGDASLDQVAALLRTRAVCFFFAAIASREKMQPRLYLSAAEIWGLAFTNSVWANAPSRSPECSNSKPRKTR